MAAADIDMFGQIRVPASKKKLEMPVTGQRFLTQTAREVELQEYSRSALQDAHTRQKDLQVRGSGEMCVSRDPSPLKVRHTHHGVQHVSYVKPEDKDRDSSEMDAATAALAMVERSMRSNSQYRQALKATLLDEQRIHFADDVAVAPHQSPTHAQTPINLSPNKRDASPQKGRSKSPARQRVGWKQESQETRETMEAKEARIMETRQAEHHTHSRVIFGADLSPHKGRAKADKEEARDARPSSAASAPVRERERARETAGHMHDVRGARTRPKSEGASASSTSGVSATSRHEVSAAARRYGKVASAAVSRRASTRATTTPTPAPAPPPASAPSTRRARVALRPCQPSAAQQVDELIRGVVGVQAVDASKSKACNKHALLVSEQEEFELSLLASHKQHDHADGLLLPAQGMRASPGGKARGMLEVGVEEDEEALQQQQEQLERDLFELKRRKQQVKLDKLHRQLVVQAQGELQTIEDELQVQLQARVMELLHDKERNKSALDAFLADLQQQMQHLQEMHEQAVAEATDLEGRYALSVEQLQKEHSLTMAQRRKEMDKHIADKMSAAVTACELE